jgi:indolepyruvate decarboxylase
LLQLGITQVFGVTGNHLGPFLTALKETCGLYWVGTPTEVGHFYSLRRAG